MDSRRPAQQTHRKTSPEDSEVISYFRKSEAATLSSINDVSIQLTGSRFLSTERGNDVHSH